MFELRDYQKAAVDAFFRFLNSRPGNPLIVLPTGSGKSLVNAEIIRQCFEQYSETRVMCLAHVEELIEQNVDELREHWPQAPVGIYSAGLGRRDTRAPIIIGGIQSVYARPLEFGPRHLVIVDECHRISKDAESMYGQFFSGIESVNPDYRRAGLTATPFRTTTGMLTHGKGKMFDSVVYSADVGMLVERGYLSPLVSVRASANIDTDGVKTVDGDWARAELELRCDIDTVTDAVVRDVLEHAKGRRRILVFGVSIKHAASLRNALQMAGESAELVTGETPKSERRQLIDGFREGRFRCLCNVDVLTTGFNVPAVDCIVLVRPTKSPGLYVQILGRGMRRADDKETCIAEGELVLTDHGEVPIERVTTAMRVWDGCSFVSHGGSILRGEREVITYAGLTATPDHQVWTTQGWQTFGQCAREQIAIAITGDRGQAVREVDHHFTEGRASREQCLLRDGVSNLRQAREQEQGESRCWHSGVQGMWQPTTGAEVAGEPMHSGAATVHQSGRPWVSELRGARDPLLLRGSDGNGGMDTREPRARPLTADRPHRQQWPVCTGQSSAVDTGAEPSAHTQASTVGQDAPIQGAAPRHHVRRRDAAQDGGDHDIKRDSESMASALTQTKRRVWDILECGPLHRFTVNGLLVHNCLILDYGANIATHGPITNVNPPKSKLTEGKVPFKSCPQCFAEVIAARRECPDCGYVWPVQEIKRKGNDEASRLDPMKGAPVPAAVWTNVIDVTYDVHIKKGDDSAPPTMRIDYYDAINGSPSKKCSQWVCIEHRTGARYKAEQLWLARGGDKPVPTSVDEACVRARKELRWPTAISTKKNGKFLEVVGVKLREERGSPRETPPWEQEHCIHDLPPLECGCGITRSLFGVDDVDGWHTDTPATNDSYPMLAREPEPDAAMKAMRVNGRVIGREPGDDDDVDRDGPGEKPSGIDWDEPLPF